MNEYVVLKSIQDVVACMTLSEQAKVEEAAAIFRSELQKRGDYGYVALGLVGAEVSVNMSEAEAAKSGN